MSLKTRNFLIVGFTFALAIGAIYSASSIRFSYEFEQFFPQGDPDLDFFYAFREQFEPDDNFLLVAIENDSSIFEERFLKNLDELTKKFQQTPDVDKVLSITNFKYLLKSPFGYVPIDALHLDEPERYAADAERMRRDPRIANTLIAPDEKSVVVFIKTRNEMLQPEADALIQAINERLSGSYPFHLLGKANFQSVLVRQQQFEFLFSTLVSSVLVTIVFFIVFGHWRNVLVGLISVLVTMILFAGFLGLSGKPLDLMSVLYPILMIIVGVSDVVHLMSKYRHEIDSGSAPSHAIKVTFREIGMATFLTSLTTSIGFLTLMTSKIPPVKTFGLLAAAGVFLAYLIAILFTTALMVVMGLEKVPPKTKRFEGWNRMLNRVYMFGKEHPKRIVSFTLAVVVFMGIGISQISTEVKIYRGLPTNDKISEDFLFFEEHFGGFRPLDIAILTKEGQHFDSYAVLRQVDSLESYMRKFDEIGHIQSYTDLYKSVEMANAKNAPEAYRFPENIGAFKKIQRDLKKVKIDEMSILKSQDGRNGRVSVRVKDVGSDSVAAVMQKIDQFMVNELDTSLFSIRQTGTGVLIDKNNEYLRESLLWGLSIAFIAIGFIMALLFRDVKMVVISLVPNTIPLLLAAALIGYFGIELNAPTAIIFAISFGIAVDDTIHFLSRFKLERRKGRSIEKALQLTIQETGKAIIVTTLILFSGFMILLNSSNPATFNVGFLISITLFSAMIADLLLIPVLIRAWLKEETKPLSQ